MLYIIANGDIIGRPRFRAIYFFIEHGVEIELFVRVRPQKFRVSSSLARSRDITSNANRN